MKTSYLLLKELTKAMQVNVYTPLIFYNQLLEIRVLEKFELDNKLVIGDIEYNKFKFLREEILNPEFDI